MQQKSKFKIEKRSGTVLYVRDNMMAIMGSDRLLYHVDLKTNQQFSRLRLTDGSVVWIYCVPSRNHVLTIMNAAEQNEPPYPDTFIDLGD